LEICDAKALVWSGIRPSSLLVVKHFLDSILVFVGVKGTTNLRQDLRSWATSDGAIAVICEFREERETRDGEDGVVYGSARRWRCVHQGSSQASSDLTTRLEICDAKALVWSGIRPSYLLVVKHFLDSILVFVGVKGTTNLRQDMRSWATRDGAIAVICEFREERETRDGEEKKR
jgi:hypothetical protein